jgi:hypothetical protein
VISGAVQGEKAKRYLEFASNMTLACYQLYNSTTSGGCEWHGGKEPRLGGACLLDWPASIAWLLYRVRSLSVKAALWRSCLFLLVLRRPLFLLPLLL